MWKFAFHQAKTGKTAWLGKMPKEPKVDRAIDNFCAFAANGGYQRCRTGCGR
jgi:hypothetical protein